MSVSERKSFWWCVLASCAGVGLYLLADFYSIKRGPYHDSPAGLIYLEALLGAIALKRLSACYDAEPANRNGRWQLSLIDLLSVLFFVGTAMTLFQSLDGNGFLYRGLPISLGLGVGYVAGLLIASRTRPGLDAFERWCFALSRLAFGIGSVFLHGIVLLVALWAILRDD